MKIRKKQPLVEWNFKPIIGFGFRAWYEQLCWFRSWRSYPPHWIKPSSMYYSGRSSLFQAFREWSAARSKSTDFPAHTSSRRPHDLKACNRLRKIKRSVLKHIRIHTTSVRLTNSSAILLSITWTWNLSHNSTSLYHAPVKIRLARFFKHKSHLHLPCQK